MTKMLVSAHQASRRSCVVDVVALVAVIVASVGVAVDVVAVDVAGLGVEPEAQVGWKMRASTQSIGHSRMAVGVARPSQVSYCNVQ